MLESMKAVRRLMDLRHRGRAEDLPAVLMQTASLLDAQAATVLLADYGQVGLHPLRSAHERRTPLEVETTLAGQAFTTSEHQWNDTGDGGVLWLPLLHGAERLGVLRLQFTTHPPQSALHDLEIIAALVAELIASRRFYGDAVEHTRRRLPMQLAAEIIWNQLPPLTYAIDGAGLLPGNAFVTRRAYPTGEPRWVFTADHQATALDVDGDVAYVAFNSGELVVLRAEDGAVQGRQQLLVNGHRVVPLSLACAGANRLAIGTLDGRVLDCSITGLPPSE